MFANLKFSLHRQQQNLPSIQMRRKYIKLMKKQNLLIFVLTIFCTALLSCENYAQSSNVTANAGRISGDQFSFSAKTAEGAKVNSYRKVNPAIMKAIDKGLDDLFAVARKHNYSAHLNYADYTVYIARPDREKDGDGNYSPAFAIASKQYAGSVYDKGGFIYVAGMVISNSPSAFLIVDYNEQNLNSISNVVRYEGEHLVLYFNDRQLYNQTADHSKGGGHPILQ